MLRVAHLVVLLLATRGTNATCNDDFPSECAMWHEAGECLNAPAYMERHCAKTCRFCSGSSSGGGSGLSRRRKLADELDKRLGAAASDGAGVDVVDRARALSLAMLRHAVQCNSRSSKRDVPATLDTTFLYVGSDLDTYPLHYLQCHERHVIFLDPLVWWRNNAAMREWYKQHPGEEAHKLSAFPKSGYHGDDGFYECPPSCDARPLTNRDHLEVGYRLSSGMAQRSCIFPSDGLARAEETDRGGPDDDWVRSIARESGLSGFVLRRQSLSNLPSQAVAVGLEPAIEFDFETQGVLRTFQLYTVPAEKFNFTRALSGKPLSTFVRVGIASDHPDFALEELCEARLVHSSLRVVGSPGPDGGMNIGRKCATVLRPAHLSAECDNCASMTNASLRSTRGKRAWPRLIGCGCGYSGRNMPCYALSKFRTIGYTAQGTRRRRTAS
jgi:hypothetical protein